MRRSHRVWYSPVSRSLRSSVVFSPSMSWSWRGSRTPRRSSSPAAMSLTASYTICGQWHPWILRPLLLPFIANYLGLVGIISSAARRRTTHRYQDDIFIINMEWRDVNWQSDISNRMEKLNRDNNNFEPVQPLNVKYRAFERHKFSIESITVGSNERIFMVSWGGPRKVITTAIL